MRADASKAGSPFAGTLGAPREVTAPSLRIRRPFAGWRNNRVSGGPGWCSASIVDESIALQLPGGLVVGEIGSAHHLSLGVTSPVQARVSAPTPHQSGITREMGGANA